MISNNSYGVHSVMADKTDDNTEGLEVVLHGRALACDSARISFTYVGTAALGCPAARVHRAAEIGNMQFRSAEALKQSENVPVGTCRSMRPGRYRPMGH
jgi:FAD/FMN-containing dehydrogenase